MSLQTVEGVQKQLFPNLEGLISKFRKPNQGLVVALQKPVARRSPCPSGGRLGLEPDDDYGNGEVGEQPGPQSGPPRRPRGRAGLRGARGSRRTPCQAAGQLGSAGSCFHT